MLISKLNVYPIILPLKFYIDRYQKPNAYIEMNPSMHIDNDGNVKILVRSINYRKYINNQFILFENHSNSLYTLLSGKIDKILDIDTFNVQEIKYNYDRPVYPTYWKGIEDIRFIDSNNILATIPECNENGNPSIFSAKLENNKIHSFIDCKPNVKEKNWMPFMINNKNYVIYSLDPFLIKEVENDSFIQLDVPTEIQSLLKDYHGSTNGIIFNGNYIFLIHVNKEKTYHRWLSFNPNNNSIQISDEFIFFRHSYIEFPVSLCKYNDRIFVSMGVNDDRAFIIELDISCFTAKLI
jgi:hypothetical protein